VPAVVRLNDGLFQEDSRVRDPLVNHDWAKQHGEAYFAGLVTNEAYVVLVAEAARQLVGYLAGHTYGPSDFRPVVAAELESIFVEPEWRGQGIGEQLSHAFLTWARERGAVWISVTAYAQNERASAFYRRLGFAPHTLTLGLHTASLVVDGH
jgi:ribosomal protein S18 acetylase RimI-like enzyme